MKINNKILGRIGFLILGILLFSSFVSAYYQTNYVQYGPYDRVDSFNLNKMFDDRMCQTGQDFIFQISPLGCEPAVVRSDLLEEQNVYVYCPISATQINPLIDVDAINMITITGKYPKEVATVGFHPAEAALNPYQNQLNQPVFLQNIGYAVIVLRRQPNESAMPNYVQGNLTAKIRYDIRNAFGVGQSQFYLPVLNEEDWNSRYKQYSFWDGRGYLRAEGAYDNSAKISIYSDRYRSGFLGQGDDKLLYSSVDLKEGETSRKLYIPGFDFCLATMQLKLDSLQNPDTTARLRINGNPIELLDGEKFLDGNCRIKRLEEQGINSEVEFVCKEDRDGFHTGDINLRITPNISLSVNGEEKNVQIGEYLGVKNKKGTKKIFLAYANTVGETNDEDDLYVYLIAIPERKHPSDKLTLDEMENAKKIAQEIYGQTDFQRDGNVWNFLKEVGEFSLGASSKFWEWLSDGESFRGIRYGYSKEVFGNLEIDVLGFSESGDMLLSEEIQEKFDLAVEDYRELINSYSNEENRYAENTLGEQSLYELIELSNELNQKRTLRELCEEFEERYPGSRKSLESCNNKLKVSSSTSSITEVLIDGRIYSISFEDVTNPSEEEYSAKIRVDYPSETGKSSKIYTLTKNDLIYLNSAENEYIMLEDLKENSAKLKLNIKSNTEFGDILRDRSEEISLNSPESFNSGYTLTLTEVKLKQVAKVSVIPNIDYSSSNASFNFRVNIDKRDIKLSPEVTQEKIKELDKKIEQWAGISDALGKIVKTMKTACLVTSAYLNIKNYIENVGGKGIARDLVMNGDQGWYDKCNELVAQGGPYSSQEECLIENSDKIDKDVNDLYGIMENQQTEIKRIEAKYTEGGELLSTDYVNTEKFANDYSETVKANIINLESVFNLDGTLSDPRAKGEDINLEDIKTIISSDSAFRKGKYSVEQLRDIDLYSRILISDASEEVKKMAEDNLYSTLLDVQVNSRNQALQFSATDSLNQNSALFNVAFSLVTDKDSKTEIYRGGETTANFGNIEKGTPIQGVIYNSQDYILGLRNVDGENYVIENIYSSQGMLIENSELLENITKRIGSFVSYSENSYKNSYSNPEIRYYETAPYKGYPAIVPFDLQKGWYAAVQQIGGIAAYSESGRVETYYLCNVGRNGKEENIGGDDICRSFVNIQQDKSNSFPGIDNPSEVTSLLRKASYAIQEAQRAYRSEIKSVTINRNNIKVGNPAVDLPGMKCQDFMSPKDCNILFNVCDPVICPPSRCNFGGNYYVQNVIQSGIFGSIALCLPNAKEGIVVPVCLSGISAGVEGLLSVFQSYRDCLQESLDTGQTVGICDEIQSIYFCEFFYNQAIPIAKLTIPRLTELIVGKGARGGGEYLGVTDAWQRAQSSVEYFAQYYAANSYKAFKQRTIEGVGQEIICDGFLSLRYPNGGGVLDALTTPDSPVQFYAKFDEIPYTSVTNPPQSMYKVYYHIYAGKDTGAYYKIYFRGSPTSSFYQDTGYSIDVATGYAPKGEYVSNTKEFVAPAGYRELCVRVNNQEECGFSPITTNFAANYVRDYYVASQVNNTEITTEKQCISGTSSLSSLVNLNLQAGVENALNPEIYNSGIIRICATENPGIGTDANAESENSRWVEVGYCGNSNLKCWLDTLSVENSIDFQNIEDDVLQTVNKNYQDILTSDGYASKEFIEGEIKEIEDETSASEKISLVNSVIEQVFYNDQKATLIYLRAGAYGELAKILFGEYIQNLKKECDLGDEKCEGSKIMRCSNEFKWYMLTDCATTNRLCTIGESGNPICVTSEEAELSENEKLLLILEEQKQELGWNSWEDVRADYSSEFNSAERNIVTNADSCSDCGTGLFNTCNKEECVAIGFRLRDVLGKNKMCVHTGLTGCEEVILEGVTEPAQLSISQINVLEKAAELEGRIVEDNINCFESANSVYEFSEVELSNCIYSDTIGRNYNSVGQIIDGNIFKVANYPEKCIVNNGQENLLQEIKLDNLGKGYLISYMYGQEKAPHNAIFIQWIDKNSRRAQLFDWNGPKLYSGEKDSAGNICTSENFKPDEIYCKTFRYYTEYLTDDRHPVYMYWKPELMSSSSNPLNLNENKLINYCGYEVYNYEYEDYSSFLLGNNIVISDINCNNIHITDNHFTQIHIIDKPISDLTNLVKLTELEDLRLVNNGLSDASQLSNLENLKVLYLTGNDLSSLPDLTSFKNLEFLDLDDNNFNKLTDITSNLPWSSFLNIPLKLNSLSIQRNCISETKEIFEKALSFRAKRYFYLGNPRSDC